MKEIQCIDIHNGFIMHKVKSPDTIYVMEKSGKALGIITVYEESDDDVVYLSNLSVDYDLRKHGIGTILQEIRELIGKNAGAKYSRLVVFNDSCMHEWYKQRGYYDLFPCEDDNKYIWMEKEL